MTTPSWPGSTSYSGAGVTTDNIVLLRGGSDSNDLVIRIEGKIDALTVDNQFVSDRYGIEEIHFADGTVWTESDIFSILLTATTGDDNLYGDGGANTFDGGAGNDYLEGRLGADTYVFGDGYDQDWLYDFDTTPGVIDAVAFNADVLEADIVLTRGGVNNNDLIITNAGVDQLTVTGQFADDATGIEELRFDGGTVWDLATIQAKLVEGTTGNDTLIGYGSDDSLDGKEGNDYLEGRAGADTYTFGLGYGQDRIHDLDVTGGVVDVVEFNADVASTDVVLSRAGNDLGDLVLGIVGTTDQVNRVPVGRSAIVSGKHRVEKSGRRRTPLGNTQNTGKPVAGACGFGRRAIRPHYRRPFCPSAARAALRQDRPTFYDPSRGRYWPRATEGRGMDMRNCGIVSRLEASGRGGGSGGAPWVRRRSWRAVS